MKKLFFVLSMVVVVLMLSISVVAAEKTDAYNRLMNTIVSKEEIKEMDWYALTDVDGNIWRADFAENGNIVCLSTQIDDYGKAHSLAYKLVGDNLDGVHAYKIPFTRHLEKTLTNEIVIPVYKDVNVDVICARPHYLYPSGEKIINSFSLNKEKGTEVIMFYTRATASFKARITSGGITANHLWGQDWYSEEEEATMESYENNSYSQNQSWQIQEDIKYSNDIASEEEIQEYLNKINQPLKEVEFGVVSNGSQFYP